MRREGKSSVKSKRAVTNLRAHSTRSCTSVTSLDGLQGPIGWLSYFPENEAPSLK